MSEEYLTVSQAAAALGISERQARRYAGRLAPDDRREAGHEAGHMTGALVSLAAMQIEREKATGRALADATPDIRPDALTHEAGHDDRPRPDATPDAQSGEVLTLLKSENAFLRGLIEQRDRDAAELRAALRSALNAMPRALTRGNESAPIEAATAPENAQVKETTPPAVSSAQRGASARVLRPWQRAVMRMIKVKL